MFLKKSQLVLRQLRENEITMFAIRCGRKTIGCSRSVPMHAPADRTLSPSLFRAISTSSPCCCACAFDIFPRVLSLCGTGGLGQHSISDGHNVLHRPVVEGAEEKMAETRWAQRSWRQGGT